MQRAGTGRLNSPTGARAAIPRSLIEQSSLSDAVLQVIREHQARPLRPIEEAWLLAGLVDEGLSGQAIAAALGKDKSWVSRRLALLSALPESLHEAVRSGEISS